MNQRVLTMDALTAIWLASDMTDNLSTAHRPRWTLAVAGAALFMTALDQLVVGVALHSIRLDLGGSIEGLEWTVNAYTLAFAVLLITGAALGDRFGRKRMFVVGVGVFTAASGLAALSPSTDALVAARALQGVGAAIVTPLTLTLISPSAAPPPSASGAGSPGSASPWARSSAGRLLRVSRGSGSSGPTSRSAWR